MILNVFNWTIAKLGNKLMVSHNLRSYVNIRSQIMNHHQFMAQFGDCPIKSVENYFLRFYSLLFDAFLNHRFMDQFQWHHFVTIFSLLSILSPFCRHLSHFTMRRRKLYSDDKLNWAIGEYYNGNKNVKLWKNGEKWCHCNWSINRWFKKHQKLANRIEGNSFKHI